jgi:hypothetical protein
VKSLVLQIEIDESRFGHLHPLQPGQVVRQSAGQILGDFQGRAFEHLG